jgi:NADPH:quinone reductase
LSLPEPETGQVQIDVRASGMNPADAERIAPGQDRSLLPLTLGSEVSGVVSAAGNSTGFSVGDEAISRASGGYATAVTVPASGVRRKPPPLTSPQAANLLLVGTTAANRSRVVSIADAARAKADGYVFIGASNPASGPFRAYAAARIVALAAERQLSSRSRPRSPR